MKIARTCRLSALVAMILAPLVFSAGPSASAQDKSGAAQKPAVRERTLAGSKKDVLATTAITKGPRSRVQLAGTFTEFSLDEKSAPQLMAVAPDGSLFFCQGGGNTIGQIVSPSTAYSGKATVREFPIPAVDSFPEGIVVAPDGNVWFTEQHASQIGKLDPKDGSIMEYKIPTANSGPVGITVGPDNNIWFTEAYSNKIGVLDPNNPESMQEFTIPTLVSAPIYITSGPDGGLWYVGVRSHKLGRIDPRSYAFVEYPTLSPQAGPTSVITGPDGALWLSELNIDKIARFDVTARKFTEEIPVNSRKNGARSGPGMLVNGPDGNIWFTEMLSNQIGRLELKTRQIHEFSVPSATTLSGVSPGPEDTAKAVYTEAHMTLKPGEELGASGGPGAIVFSQDGAIWYISIFINKVGRLAL